MKRVKISNTLFQEGENVLPVKMKLTLRNNTDNVVAWLLFRVKDADKLNE